MGSPQRRPARFLTKTSLHDRYQEMTERPRVRKRSLSADTATVGGAADEIDIACCATIAYSSEDPAHPVENMLDGQSGPGGTHWVSARPDTAEHIVVEFDQPQAISRLVYEVEERGANARRRCAWKRRTMEAGRIARFWFRNTISVPGEPPFSAKTNASICRRLPISVSRLFQTRVGQARRLSRHSVSSLRRLPVSKLERLLTR